MEKVRWVRWEGSAAFGSVGAACGLTFARLSAPKISLGFEGRRPCSQCVARECLFRRYPGWQALSDAGQKRKE
jgi:hypothetical protein